MFVSSSRHFGKMVILLWSRMPSFMKKIILSQSNSFLEVFRISPLSKSQSMIWYLRRSGVKYGNSSKGLEINWNFAKMIAYAFFHEKIISSQSNSFLEVFRISPLSKSQSMIWYLGKSGLKYGNLSKWLEITWNFAKMIAYAFFHEKNHFDPVKLVFGVFRISPLSKSQSMIWYLGKSGVKHGNLSKWLEITWNFAKMITYAFFHEKIILSQSNSFLEGFRISPLSKSQSMIWYLGKSGVKYGNLSKWLEITWNFAKMIAYAFFHEKNHFEPVKLLFGSFQNFTLV